eukprot:gene33543-41393_t
MGRNTFADGSVYEGEVRDNMCCGQGRLTDEIGVYTGQFEDNDFNGTGVMQFHEGDVYSGQWREGEMHGRCRLHFSDDDSVFEGEFVRGECVGTGTLTHADGQIELDV